MQKNLNINKIRAIACLLVLVYHCYALCGPVSVHIPFLHEYVVYGGTIGVTAFFVLGGYGIYSSLYAAELYDSKISFKEFIIKRIKRIVPHYYFNLLFALLFTSSAVYLDRIHFNNIISHLFFLHSFSFSWHGAINGVLWTMAITFQFYLIAIPMYRFVKKFKLWSVILAVIFTIIANYVTLNYFWIADETVYGNFAFSIPGRQLWTALDNFVIGMYVAQVVNTKKRSMPHRLWAAGGVFVCTADILHLSTGKSLWCLGQRDLELFIS